MMNEAFIAATRSTAFSLSLSHHMIDALLWCHDAQLADEKHADLETRFPWISSGNWLRRFGHDSIDKCIQNASQSERALLRRGLIHFTEWPKVMGQTRVYHPDVHPVWQPRPTKAGMILAELLYEAGFDRTAEHRPRPKVGLHPDDRPVIHLGHEQAEIEHRHDRRADRMVPGDEAYFDPPLRTERVR